MGPVACQTVGRCDYGTSGMSDDGKVCLWDQWHVRRWEGVTMGPVACQTVGRCDYGTSGMSDRGKVRLWDQWHVRR